MIFHCILKETDGSKGKIELYTAASKNEVRNMSWDEGQNRLLLIEDGNNYYPLFQQYVQLRLVYFTYGTMTKSYQQ